MNKMIYLVRIYTDLSNGTGDPLRIPISEAIEVKDATEMVSKSEVLLDVHRADVRTFLGIKEGWYVLSSDIQIQLVGFGTLQVPDGSDKQEVPTQTIEAEAT